uniref:PARP catalytic domain-containing protein n=1 Tax=Macrostomum lignano TaxID=282301 RepID=A0A1I8HEF9_9PLAT
MVFSRYSSIRTSRLFSFVRLRSLARCRAAADAFPLVALLPGSSHFSAPSSCTSCRSSASTIRSSASRVHIQQAEAVNVEIFEFATVSELAKYCVLLKMKAIKSVESDPDVRDHHCYRLQPSPTHRVEIPFLRREPGPALLSEAELVDAPSVAQVGLELLPVARVGQAGAGEHAAERDGEVVLEHQPDELHQLDQKASRSPKYSRMWRRDWKLQQQFQVLWSRRRRPRVRFPCGVPPLGAAAPSSGSSCVLAASSGLTAALSLRPQHPHRQQPLAHGFPFLAARSQSGSESSCMAKPSAKILASSSAIETPAGAAFLASKPSSNPSAAGGCVRLLQQRSGGPAEEHVPLRVHEWSRDENLSEGRRLLLVAVAVSGFSRTAGRAAAPVLHQPIARRHGIAGMLRACRIRTHILQRESQLHELSLGHERSVRCPEGPVESPIGGLAGAATPSSSASILRSGRSSPTKVHRVLFYRQAPLGGHLLEDAPAGVLQSAAAVLQEAAHLGVEQDIVRVGPPDSQISSRKSGSKMNKDRPRGCDKTYLLAFAFYLRRPLHPLLSWLATELAHWRRKEKEPLSHASRLQEPLRSDPELLHLLRSLCHQFRASDLGCFVDSATERDVRGLKYLGLTRVGGHGMEQTNISSAYGLVHSTQMTHELCGFRYMALQAATWCGCDNSYGSHGAAPSGDCWHACAGTAVHTGIKREPFIVLGDRDLVAMSSPDSRRFLDRQRSWTRRVRRPVRHRLSVGDLQPAAAPVPPAGVCMLQSRPPSEAPAAATSSSDFVSILHLLLTLDNKELNSKHGFLGPGCCGLQPSRGNGHAFRPADAGESKTSLAVFLLWGGDSWPLGRNTAPLLRRIASQGRKIDLHAGRRDSDAGADSLLVDPSERQLNTHCFIDLDTSSKKTLITVRYELSAGGASRTFEACVLLGCTAGFLRVLRHQILDMRNYMMTVFPWNFRGFSGSRPTPTAVRPPDSGGRDRGAAGAQRVVPPVLVLHPVGREDGGPALISVLPNNVLLQAGENSRFDFVIRTLGPIDKAQRCSDHLKDDEEDQPVGVRCGHAVNAETLRREGQDRPGGEDAGEAEEVEQPVPDADARSRQRHGPAVQEQQPLRVQPQVDGHGDEGHRGRQVEGGAEHLRGFENFPGISHIGSRVRVWRVRVWRVRVGDSGFGGSGFGESGFGDPGLETPGLEGPGLEIPGLETPGLGVRVWRLRVWRSGFGESGFGDSGFGESGFGKSGFGESGFGDSRHKVHECLSIAKAAVHPVSPCAVSQQNGPDCLPSSQRELTVMNPYRMTFSRYSSSSISCSLDLTRCRCSANASLPLGLVSPSLAMWLRSSSARISSSTDAILYSRPHDVGTAFEQRLAHHVAGGGDVQQVEAVDRCVGEGHYGSRPHLPHEGDIEQWSIVVGKAEGEGLDGE